MLSDLQGCSENLGFVQTVALERLTPVELLPLTQVSEDSPTRIRIDDKGRMRDATITAQSIDGEVYIKYDDESSMQLPAEHCVDLASAKYYWV